MDNSKNIEKEFSKISKDYDSQRKFFIPCFDDFYLMAAKAASERIKAKAPLAIDLGAGTGILAAKFLELKSGSKLKLIDISKDMLELAKLRFKNCKNVDYECSDIRKFAIDKPCDCIMSALAIHHLADKEKKAVYKKAFESLKSNGIFVNAEQVLGDSKFEISLNAKQRQLIIKEHLSGEDAIIAKKRLKLDKCASITKNIKWLKKAGFSYVYCPYKYYDFAVIVAIK